MSKNSKTSGSIMVGLLIFLTAAFWGLGGDRAVEDKIIPTPETADMSETPPSSTAIETPLETPPEISPATNDPKADSNVYKVIKVVDGDTLAVDIAGHSTTVRMIGVDTPETVDPRKPVQCFGVEASNKSKTALSGQSVKLEFDPSQGKLDKYGRLLAYVFLPDGTNWNDRLIRDGYAHEYTYRLPYKYQTQFKEAEKFARENDKGLWGPGVCDLSAPAPAPAPVKTASPAAPTNSSEYLCGGDIYNCTSFATHTEAQAAYESCGGVNNDVHGLDRDKDGLACETLPN